MAVCQFGRGFSRSLLVPRPTADAALGVADLVEAEVASKTVVMSQVNSCPCKKPGIAVMPSFFVVRDIEYSVRRLGQLVRWVEHGLFAISDSLTVAYQRLESSSDSLDAPSDSLVSRPDAL